MEEVVQCQAYRYFPGEPRLPRVKYSSLGTEAQWGWGVEKHRGPIRAFKGARSIDLFSFFRLFRLKENIASWY